MNQSKIKDINIPEFLQEEANLKVELQMLRKIYKDINAEAQNLKDNSLDDKFITDFFSLLLSCELGMQMEAVLRKRVARLKEARSNMYIMREALIQFPSVLRRAFPIESNSSVIKKLLNELNIADFETTEELQNYLFMILLRVCFSNENYKVFDLEDEDYFDSDVLAHLFDKEITVSGAWFDQFLYCLYAKTHEENLTLIKQTVGLQIMHVSPLITELHGLSIDSLMPN